MPIQCNRHFKRNGHLIYKPYVSVTASLGFRTDHEAIVQIRVGGLPPISKHQEELKLRGEAEHF